MKRVGIFGYRGLSKLRVFIQLKFYANNYNGFMVTSQNKANNICKSFLIASDKVKSLGQPRNDMLFINNDKKEILKKLYNNQLPLYNKIILYAPTYRNALYGNAKLQSTIFFPFDDLNIDKLNNYLEDNKLIIFLRPHPLDNISFSEQKRIKFMKSDLVPEITNILNIFDLLISDYSAISFDFLLLNRPEIFLPYDKDIYMKEVGIAYDYNMVTPGPKPMMQKEFLLELSTLLENDQYFSEERSIAIDFLYNDETKQLGNSKRITHFIEEEIERYNK